MGVFRDERDEPLEFELGDTYQAIARVIRRQLDEMHGNEPREIVPPPELGAPYGAESLRKQR